MRHLHLHCQLICQLVCQWPPQRSTSTSTTSRPTSTSLPTPHLQQLRPSPCLHSSSISSSSTSSSSSSKPCSSLRACTRNPCPSPLGRTSRQAPNMSPHSLRHLHLPSTRVPQ